MSFDRWQTTPEFSDIEEPKSLFCHSWFCHSWVNWIYLGNLQLHVLSSGAILFRRSDWTRIQNDTSSCWRFSWNWVLLHVASPCYLCFSQGSKRYHYVASPLPHSLAQPFHRINSRKEERKIPLLHDPSYYPKSIIFIEENQNQRFYY
jgi:hypothetical protein